MNSRHKREAIGRRACHAALTALLALPALIAQADGSISAGRSAFRLCASCHQVGPSARSSFGPQLNGIIGRPAAALSDYRYSKAMQQSGIIWTEARLRAFLRDPDAVVPGTRMRLWGISDEQKMTDLLAYLRSFEVPASRSSP